MDRGGSTAAHGHGTTGGAAPDGRLLVLVSPSGGRGGAETMLLRAALAARSRGWRVRCLVPRGPLATDLRAAGAEVHLVPALRLPDGPRLVAAGVLAAAALRVGAVLRRTTGGADVVLANGLLCLPSLWAAGRSAARVWWVHDVIVRSDRLHLARRAGRGLDLLVGVSDAVLRPLSTLGAPSQVVRNGVDTAQPRGPRERAAARRVIGCTAALTPWKGQDVLLEAVALLDRPDVHVELLGAAQPKDAAYEQALRDRAEQPDLRGRVHLLGHVPDPLTTMRRWDVGVSASVDPEASGLGVLEGMSLGVPQVVTDHGGPPEVVGDAGLVVPPRDAPALAAALERLLDDDDLWQRCSRTGPSVIADRLHRPVQEQALLEALDRAASLRRA